MLPAPLAELWSAWNELRAAESGPLRLVMVGPLGPAREQLRQWLAGPSPVPSSLVMGSEDQPLLAADAYLLVLPSGTPLPAQLKNDLHREARNKLMVAVLGPSKDWPAQRQALAQSLGIPSGQIAQGDDMAQLLPRLAARFIAAFPDMRLSLGRQFPVLRAEAAAREIQSTAQQNAAVGALPIPGADLPLMSANQVKMVLRLATIYNQELGPERLKEVMATLGGGVAMRAAARQLAKFVPGPGWLLAGAMGYSGTLAMGKAAQSYFQRDAHPSLPPVGNAIDAKAEVVDGN